MENQVCNQLERGGGWVDANGWAQSQVSQGNKNVDGKCQNSRQQPQNRGQETSINSYIYR